jgi:hypothetical protein
MWSYPVSDSVADTLYLVLTVYRIDKATKKKKKADEMT